MTPVAGTPRSAHSVFASDNYRFIFYLSTSFLEIMDKYDAENEQKIAYNGILFWFYQRKN